MSDVVWTADMEASLFYAMIDHKPVGETKHFHMAFIYEKYNNLNEKKLTASQIWYHLGTLYDLQALNENEVIPFPNDEEEFSLPEKTFGSLLKKYAPEEKPPEEKPKEAVKEIKESKTSKEEKETKTSKEEKQNKEEKTTKEPVTSKETKSTKDSNKSSTKNKKSISRNS